MFGDREKRFAGQDNLMARQFAQAFTDGFLGLARRIDVRGVEEVDAEIEGAMDESGGLREVDSRAEGQPGSQ